MILETERLILREMGQADLPHDLAEILQDQKLCLCTYEHDFHRSDVQEWQLTGKTDRYRKYSLDCGQPY